MLKFFRRIRRKLIDEGNLKRYLIYGLGEILLVVIGILIALQVNNLNESRKANDQERELAANLYQELLTVQAYCSKVFLPGSSEEIKLNRFYLENWRHLNLEMVEEFREDELRTMIGKIPLNNTIGRFHYYYDPKIPFYNSAVNDGALSILKDKLFVNQLNFIHTTGYKRVSSFYEMANELNKSIDHHIAQNYHAIFLEPDLPIRKDREKVGNWDASTYDLFLQLVGEDGTLRFMIENRLTALEYKRFTVEQQILPAVNKAVEHYEQSEYHSSSSRH